MKKILFTLMIILSVAVGRVHAQDLYIHAKDGTFTTIAKTDIKKVTFVGDKMMVTTASGTQTYSMEAVEEVNKSQIMMRFVDLGLPSGLKWADRNVGADSPEDYGDYYAWGETQTKSTYTESNSKWYGVGYSSLQSQGVIDSDRNLTATYDVATQKCGSGCRMPTLAEFEELIDNCTWKWTTQNGVSGRLVTGKNGNSIFFPAAGYRSGSSLYYVGSYGNYWSSTADDDYYHAYYLDFNSDNYYWDGNGRNYGPSVRPVRE